MARTAHLPGGQVLQFPDETPDEVMDAAVLEHLASQPEEARPVDQNAMVLAHAAEVFAETMAVLQDQSDKVDSQQAQATAALTEVQASAAQANAKAVGDAAAALSVQIGNLSESVAKLGESTPHIMELVQAVDGLAEVVAYAAKNIVETLLLPNKVARDKNRDITLVFRDPAGGGVDAD